MIQSDSSCTKRAVKKVLTLLTVAVFSGLSAGTAANAAQNHFSKARPESGRYLKEMSPVIRQTTNNATIFDVVISLYNDPEGDENPDNNMTDEVQARYENIIRRWADAVYEQSNGGHKLGKVRIFRNGRQASKADVVWNEKEWPRANVSGFGTDGLRITFGDIFPDGNGPGDDYDMLANPEGAGYTLGHEWGHYVYGLYDEYVGSATGGSITSPQADDTPADDAIMNSQWQAVGGHFEWLNHSTANNYEANTAQGRAYGASCWDVLIRDYTADPRDGDRTTLPKRTHFTALDDKAPTADDNWIINELPANQEAARSSLDIIWMQEDIEMQIVIDRSGSMFGAPLDNAKQAARSLVDVVQVGKTALGITTFSSDASQDFDIAPIPDPDTGIKTAAQSVIENINAGGSTAMYDGAQLALANLQAFKTANDTSANQVVFLLSDGADNASTETQTTVTDAFLAADVPLITFGYGSGAPGGVLRELADDTGGLFFSSPTTLSEIQSAFLSANTTISDASALTSDSVSLPSDGTTNAHAFQVDSTIETLTVVASYDGQPGDVAMVIKDTNGTDLGTTFTESYSGTAVSAVAYLDNAALTTGGAGTWTLELQSANGADVDVTINVIGNAGNGQTYDVTVGILGGSTITYPEPIVVTATVSKGLPITGVNLSAVISDPSGSDTAIAMNDAGTDGDAIASDGIYSAIVSYPSSGTYTLKVVVDNRNATAQFSTASFQPTHSFSADINGDMPIVANLPDITENFSRSASKQVTVTTYHEEDHGNSPDQATLLVPDNTDTAGRIDYAGDSDFFSVTGIDTTQNLVIRVTDLAVGMEPIITIYAADGTTQVATGDMAESISENGYLYLTLTPEMIDPEATMYAKIEHADTSADQGNYTISAGPAIVSDQAKINTDPPAPAQDDEGGGGAGCFIDLIMAE